MGDVSATAKYKSLNKAALALALHLSGYILGSFPGYETAWQGFFLTESDIIGTEKDITGELKIHCNDCSKPIVWKTEVSHGKFVIVTLQFS
ncbi:hypothetical protein FVEG_14890 [Fusarium verticillioides 7600]|uniref:Uncharacterized protein n=1 Tax=Gibberella moniliformis (strain M3125 / FGSC 7600) TaxID=334819 RepID=W7LIS8_GIBM7|nr:hypothetical protein FVEG_14890 [Fusarium verticillioides 7600]EWG38426.1 hypothetical protein FVEG_14890 [Fusarium verticillioides 7600]